MRGQPTNTSLGVVLQLIKQYRLKQVSPEGFTAIFDVLHRTIEGILPSETNELTYRLYSLSRDWGDPDPLHCTTAAQLDAEIDLLTPKLETLFLEVVNKEPFYTRPDPDNKPDQDRKSWWRGLGKQE